MSQVVNEKKIKSLKKVKSSRNVIEITNMNKWFGSFHDGSQEADEAMKARAMTFHSK